MLFILMSTILNLTQGTEEQFQSEDCLYLNIYTPWQVGHYTSCNALSHLLYIRQFPHLFSVVHTIAFVVYHFGSGELAILYFHSSHSL